MKKPQSQLVHEIADAAQRVMIGGIYAHYKDVAHTYRVLNLAINADDSSVWVIYEALYDEQVTFLRSVDEWCETVEFNGQRVERFTLIDTHSS